MTFRREWSPLMGGPSSAAAAHMRLRHDEIHFAITETYSVGNQWRSSVCAFIPHLFRYYFFRNAKKLTQIIFYLLNHAKTASFFLCRILFFYSNIKQCFSSSKILIYSFFYNCFFVDVTAPKAITNRKIYKTISHFIYFLEQL